MAYADNVAIGTKRRRHVEKTGQDTSNVYSSKSASNPSDYTLSKNKGIDKLQGIKDEKRGRSNKGNAKKSPKNSKSKIRQRRKSNISKAKRGGK